MKQVADRYVSSVQAERFYRGTRHYWTICSENKPDELVAWGHAPTQEMAEAAARHELEDLSSGISKGGRAIRTRTAFTQHR